MRTQPSGARQRLGFASAALAAALLLTACGSDNDDHQAAPGPAPAPAPTPTPTPPPVAAVDAFFAFVSAQVASLLDTAEPVAIDSVTATAPDNTEPEAVQ